MRRPAARRRRARNGALVLVAGVLVVGVNAPFVAALADEVATEYRTSRPEYRAAHGSWETVELPEEFRVNAIHAALLRTGKVLIVAGSGNDQRQFDEQEFSTILYDPAESTYERIETPEDLFCAGHAFLPNGNLLIAGGTRKYEVLEEDITHAAGTMTVKNESPDGAAYELPVGTVFVGEDGQRYRSTEVAAVEPAMQHEMDGEDMLMASEADVWVEALEEGPAPVVEGGHQFRVEDLPAGTPEGAVYGIADTITLKKQEYRGLDASYEFDVEQERYVPTGDLTESRWYPTLVGMPGGNVLAVSGLDEHGKILDGQNEVYERHLRRWYDKPGLKRYFPTYPSLFRLADNRYFYSGSNAGYGSDEEGRQPGVWDLKDNLFEPVGGLPEPEMNETSASVLLPPAQDQKVMILGGGEVGDGPASTARTAVADLDADDPRYVRGPDLPAPTRYLSTVVLPDDTVLLTGGSSGYRGAGDSDLHETRIYHPASGEMRVAAPNEIGRNYHSEALLLPDGRVLTLGSDPLYGDEAGELPGTFEHRLEVYTPPYRYGERSAPSLTDGPQELVRGATVRFGTDDPGDVATARLVRPSAVTHVTDPEQRSVALDVTPREGAVDLSVPEQEGLVPSGWYMLFVADAEGTPSQARWVHVP